VTIYFMIGFTLAVLGVVWILYGGYIDEMKPFFNQVKFVSFVTVFYPAVICVVAYKVHRIIKKDE
jgi:hypothetical protein